MVSHRPQPDNTVIEDRIMMIGGLSMRDYFAAAALSGIMASENHTDKDDLFLSCSDTWYDSCADHCYQIANAMLAARKECA